MAVSPVRPSGKGGSHINEVALRRSHLVLGRITLVFVNLRSLGQDKQRNSSSSECSGLAPGAGSRCNQPPRLPQPGHPFMDRRNKHRSIAGGCSVAHKQLPSLIEGMNCLCSVAGDIV